MMIFVELAYEKSPVYIGCYRDYSQLHHMSVMIAKGQMTPEICTHLCKIESAAFAGLTAGYV